MVALSPDYESKSRLREIIKDTKQHILRFLETEESDLVKAL